MIGTVFSSTIRGVNRSALGGQRVARFCMTDEDSTELERLTDLPGSTVNEAHLAREGRNTRK